MKNTFALCLLAGFMALAAPVARANEDVVHFGSNIHVAKGTTTHDTVCFFCNVNVEGEVQGDVVVFFGSVQLAGKAHHDVVNFFGGITADDNASIGGDMVSFFGMVRLGQNVSVGKDLVAMFGGVHAPESVTVGGDRVTFPGVLFFGPVFIIGFVIWLIVHEVRDRRRRLYMAGFPPR
jgi:hypothetical protein